MRTGLNTGRLFRNFPTSRAAASVAKLKADVVSFSCIMCELYAAMMKETSPHVRLVARNGTQRMKSLEAFVSLARQFYLIAGIIEAWVAVIN